MIVVRYIDVVPWKRWRHERLRKIWWALDQYNDFDGLHILPFKNNGRLSHAQCLNDIYEKARQSVGVSKLIITEQDFLPNAAPWVDWVDRALEDLEDSEAEILAPVRQRANKGDTAPFFMVFDMAALWDRELEFDHPRDPAADLHKQADVQHFTGKLQPEVHDGWNYRYGTHLLYQRHLHDPVDNRCGDVILGEMQERHDSFVETWIENQDAEFRRLYDS
jgi:hypothetical protein